MKNVIQINYIFWNEGPLLPRLLCKSILKHAESDVNK
jgi:hypothetical protein